MATATLLLLAMSAVPASAATTNFIAVINGGQEVPPSASHALGNAFLTFDTCSDIGGKKEEESGEEKKK